MLHIASFLFFRIDFPFLVFLLSGGHCLLAVARDIDDFLLLGTTMDRAPGEAFDKVCKDCSVSVLQRRRGNRDNLGQF